MSIMQKVILIVLNVAVGLSIGLFLRGYLVRRLKRTVLDNWIVQTFGILIIVPPLILSSFLIPLIYEWNIAALVSLWNLLKPSLSQKDLASFGINALETIILLSLGIGLARTLQKLALRGLGENRIDINLRTLIGRILYIAMMIIVTFWVLAVWQLPIGIPAATVGVITVAITVAIQDVLKDLAAGFYILIERPFFIGDQISLATYTGKVEDVQLRATKLRLVSGEEVTIPNSHVFSGIVINNFYYKERRATITITLSQEQFVREKTPQQIIEALNDIEHIMSEPAPKVECTSYSNSRITLTLRFWVTSGQLSNVSDVMYALHSMLPDAELAVVESAGTI